MFVVLVMSLIGLVAAGVSQEPQMMTYQMALLRRVPDKQPSAAEAPALQQAHLAHLVKLHKDGVNVLFGPFLDQPDGLEGLCILDVKDADAARAALNDDPFVKAGYMAVDVLPWFGPKGWFQKAGEPHTPEPFVFGFLMRATPAAPVPAADAAAIQRGHLGYMDELHKQGKLVAAGPFGGGGDRRGIVIYRVATVAEAQALAANDPAVKAGLLRIDARRWMTFKGILK